MPFSATTSHPTRKLVLLFAAVTAAILVIGILRDYRFLPSGGGDGFLSQVLAIQKLVVAGDWGLLISRPLGVIHLVRFICVAPFLAAERLVGPAGSLLLLCMFLWPLLMTFRMKAGGWKGAVVMAARLAVLFLPLFVSGRTVLVAASMGYLVSGIMMRPFSWPRMVVGVFFATLSSATVLFSAVILLLAGNWRNRSRSFYVAKIGVAILAIGLLIPSLFAKAEGFTTGANGYSIETFNSIAPVPSGSEIDGRGVGLMAAVERVLLRSTVVQSYQEGNTSRLALYIGLWAAALAFIAWSAIVRRWHPMLVVLAILSTGIFVEGLALWPILFPVIWSYTGIDMSAARGSRVR
ncbi:hypothetical protein [Devosia sp. A369]